MPSGALQSGENDAVGGDADEEERAGRGVVVDGAVVVLLVADLDGGQLCALDGVGGSVRRPCSAPRAQSSLMMVRPAEVDSTMLTGVLASSS